METQRQDTRLGALLELADGVELDEERLIKLGDDVVRLAELDDNSRQDWLKKSEIAMELALQVTKEKSTPWKNASNVKYPLITTAAIQFHARAYPAIVQGSSVVKAQVTGFDPDGRKSESAKRISTHMSWQLLEENDDWEPDTDRMLLALAIEGCEFKKTFFSRERGHNISEWVRPKDLIVHEKTKSLHTCPRITHRLYFYPHEIDARVRAGVWLDADLNIPPNEYEEEVQQEFFEQHTFLDLDDDGFKEPYIVTVHRESRRPVRVVAGFYKEDIEVEFQGKRGSLGEFSEALLDHGLPEEQAVELMAQARVLAVPRVQMFTKFGLIPPPDGSFYDIGFGQLVGPLSDSVDTMLNQLIDAGTLANTQAGFAAQGVSIDNQRGPIEWERGKFKTIKIPTGKSINDCIFQLKFPDPSLVLFNVLGTLIQSAKDVTSVQDIMSGAAPNQEEKATTTMIRIEQGMKVFSAIYKRIYRSLKYEFRKLYKLNARYLEDRQYYRVLDTGEQQNVFKYDYQGDGTDVQPVADPQLATTLLAMAKNQQLMPLTQFPEINREDILRRYVHSLDVPNPDSCFLPPEARQQPPDPKLIELQLKAQIAASEHSARVAKAHRDFADAVKKMAEAESIEEGQQLQQYVEMTKLALQAMANDQGRQTGMGGVPGNQASIGPAQENPVPIPAGIG